MHTFINIDTAELFEVAIWAGPGTDPRIYNVADSPFARIANPLTQGYLFSINGGSLVTVGDCLLCPVGGFSCTRITPADLAEQYREEGPA